MADEKTEMRFMVDSDYLEALQARLNKTKTTDIARTALTLLQWAAGEVWDGRLILSTEADGNNPRVLVLPGLTDIHMRVPLQKTPLERRKIEKAEALATTGERRGR